jgi:hypothetical protein
LSKTEQFPLAGATEERHEDVGEVWQEYIWIVILQRLAHEDIRLAVKAPTVEASLQLDTSMLK